MAPKRKRGDRKDGRWLREMDSFHKVMIHLFPNRCEAEIYSLERFDVTDLIRMVEEQNREHPELDLKPFHVFVAAVAKTICQRRDLNRFVAGRRMYQREGITFAFVVKRQMEDQGEELLMVMEVNPEMTLLDISRQILGDTKTLRDTGENDADFVIDWFAKLPRFLQMLAMKGFRFLDFYGLMPESITKGDTNYVTVLLSNLGSIGAGPAYHHLNNYGTNSIMMTIGTIRKETVRDPDDTPRVRDIVEFGVTVDERIADGFYFARSNKLLRHFLEHPGLLLEPLGTEIEMEGR